MREILIKIKFLKFISIPFNINQLINAKTVHLGLSGYEARALIYQKILLQKKLRIS